VGSSETPKFDEHVSKVGVQDQTKKTVFGMIHVPNSSEFPKKPRGTVCFLMFSGPSYVVMGGEP